MRKTIEIPAPVALPEQVVLVRNYRLKPAAWEIGTVQSVSFSPTFRRTAYDGSKYTVNERWLYSVWIDRPVIERKYGRNRGGGYRIEVGDDDIRADEEAS